NRHRGTAARFRRASSRCPADPRRRQEQPGKHRGSGRGDRPAETMHSVAKPVHPRPENARRGPWPRLQSRRAGEAARPRLGTATRLDAGSNGYVIPGMGTAGTTSEEGPDRIMTDPIVVDVETVLRGLIVRDRVGWAIHRDPNP